MLPNPTTGQLECLLFTWFQPQLITHCCNGLPFFLFPNNVYIKHWLVGIYDATAGDVGKSDEQISSQH